MLGWGEGHLAGLISRGGQWKSRGDHDENVFCREDEMLNSRETWRVIYPDLFYTRPSLTRIDISHPQHPQLHSDSI